MTYNSQSFLLLLWHFFLPSYSLSECLAYPFELSCELWAFPAFPLLSCVGDPFSHLRTFSIILKHFDVLEKVYFNDSLFSVKEIKRVAVALQLFSIQRKVLRLDDYLLVVINQI